MKYHAMFLAILLACGLRLAKATTRHTEVCKGTRNELATRLEAIVPLPWSAEGGEIPARLHKNHKHLPTVYVSKFMVRTKYSLPWRLYRYAMEPY